MTPRSVAMKNMLPALVQISGGRLGLGLSLLGFFLLRGGN